MGQAKRRGTFEQRRDAAIKLYKEKQAERDREEINRKQRERYRDASTGYRGYLLDYQREYKRLYFHGETNASK